MKLKSWKKKILSIFIIIVGSLILFNLAFLLASIMIGVIDVLIGKMDIDYYFHFIIYYIMIIIMSYLIFKSKLNDVGKATFLTVPLMVTLVLLGIALSSLEQFLIILIGAFLVLIVLLFISIKRLPWVYYFAVFYVALLSLLALIYQIGI